METVVRRKAKPLVTLAVGAYNEGGILEKHLDILSDYMTSLENDYDWEIVLVNDGSHDETAEIAERFAVKQKKLRVFHHRINQGLGKTLQDAFQKSRGDYVITLDIDLSCGPDNIERLLKKIEETGAKVVVASPYTDGGKMSNVPAIREYLSRAANRYLCSMMRTNLTSLTCMVRAYEGDFIRSLNLRADGMEIMPEILNKAIIMREKIEEIPTHLDWGLQLNPEVERRSSMRVLRHTLATLLTGFLMRPFLFFILPGILLLLFSLYPNAWMFIHFFEQYGQLTEGSFLDRASDALRLSYHLHPHTFFIGLLSLLMSIQLIAVGFQSLQSKHYFEEMFSLLSKSKERIR